MSKSRRTGIFPVNRMDTGALDEGGRLAKGAKGEGGRRQTGFFPRGVWWSVSSVHGAVEGVLGGRRGKGEERERG